MRRFARIGNKPATLLKVTLLLGFFRIFLNCTNMVPNSANHDEYHLTDAFHLTCTPFKKKCDGVLIRVTNFG